ncbi:hypothetical protein H696_00232 [Fonticula alba]|uniref:Phosphoinositide phospholipase C n=1 Tax=Fonticula alba TaxID=691883 RepID=A0A058ZFC0_FONAL|nr:hypothetical protein H696_00232 [Fonticula alba]KCV72651.1 hypothetical protein H696_00232 [Fonticula alba]|eukprot:XP_009492352.1 hypothetical protein H696_00232 [Fonticula alba]
MPSDSSDPICPGCELAISNERALRVGKHLYHLACVVCSICHLDISTTGIYLDSPDPMASMSDDEPALLCRDHFFEHHGTRCSACGALVTTGSIVTVDITKLARATPGSPDSVAENAHSSDVGADDSSAGKPANFHADCFRCYRCRKLFDSGERVMVARGQPTCVACTSSSCAACMAPISLDDPDVLSLHDRRHGLLPFHRGCLACSVCRQPCTRDGRVIYYKRRVWCLRDLRASFGYDIYDNLEYLDGGPDLDEPMPPTPKHKLPTDRPLPSVLEGASENVLNAVAALLSAGETLSPTEVAATVAAAAEDGMPSLAIAGDVVPDQDAPWLLHEVPLSRAEAVLLLKHWGQNSATSPSSTTAPAAADTADTPRVFFVFRDRDDDSHGYQLICRTFTKQVPAGYWIAPITTSNDESSPTGRLYGLQSGDPAATASVSGKFPTIRGLVEAYQQGGDSLPSPPPPDGQPLPADFINFEKVKEQPESIPSDLTYAGAEEYLDGRRRLLVFEQIAQSTRWHLNQLGELAARESGPTSPAGGAVPTSPAAASAGASAPAAGNAQDEDLAAVKRTLARAEAEGDLARVVVAASELGVSGAVSSRTKFHVPEIFDVALKILDSETSATPAGEEDFDDAASAISSISTVSSMQDSVSIFDATGDETLVSETLRLGPATVAALRTYWDAETVRGREPPRDGDELCMLVARLLPAVAGPDAASVQAALYRRRDLRSLVTAAPAAVAANTVTMDFEAFLRVVEALYCPALGPIYALFLRYARACPQSESMTIVELRNFLAREQQAVGLTALGGGSPAIFQAPSGPSTTQAAASASANTEQALSRSLGLDTKLPLPADIDAVLLWLYEVNEVNARRAARVHSGEPLSRSLSVAKPRGGANAAGGAPAESRGSSLRWPGRSKKNQPADGSFDPVRIGSDQDDMLQDGERTWTPAERVFGRFCATTADGLLTIFGFANLLLGRQSTIMNPVHATTVYQDMTRPLSHYFIDSSHNTYLEGDQLKSNSTTEAYRKSLISGCRCIELDLWEGPRGEPLIYHGYTLTSRIRARLVLEEIARSAFVTTDYPLILSLENHLGHSQQRTFVKYCREVFGDSMVDFTTGFWEKNPAELPSPEELRGKIIIKNKAHESRGQPTQPTDKASREISDIVVYTKASHFPSLTQARDGSRCYEMVSIPEKKAFKMARFSFPLLFSFAQHRFARIYPDGMRFDSSNFDPSLMWATGVPMVALNAQRPDRANHLNRGKFADNGGCGYVLKPLAYRPEVPLTGPLAPETLDALLERPVGVTVVRIRLLAAYGFARHARAARRSRSRSSRWAPAVQLEMAGLNTSSHLSSPGSSIGLLGSYMWADQSFETLAVAPENSLLRFTVHGTSASSSTSTGSSNNSDNATATAPAPSDTLGEFTICVANLLPGTRTVRLRPTNLPFGGVSLSDPSRRPAPGHAPRLVLNISLEPLADRPMSTFLRGVTCVAPVAEAPAAIVAEPDDEPAEMPEPAPMPGPAPARQLAPSAAPFDISKLMEAALAPLAEVEASSSSPIAGSLSRRATMRVASNGDSLTLPSSPPPMARSPLSVDLPVLNAGDQLPPVPAVAAPVPAAATAPAADQTAFAASGSFRLVIDADETTAPPAVAAAAAPAPSSPFVASPTIRIELPDPPAEEPAPVPAPTTEQAPAATATPGQSSATLTTAPAPAAAAPATELLTLPGASQDAPSSPSVDRAPSPTPSTASTSSSRRSISGMFRSLSRRSEKK